MSPGFEIDSHAKNRRNKSTNDLLLDDDTVSDDFSIDGDDDFASGSNVASPGDTSQNQRKGSSRIDMMKSSLSTVFSNFNTNAPFTNFINSAGNEEEYEDYLRDGIYQQDKDIEYEDMSAIDWQREYANDRARKDKMHQQPGLYGKILWVLEVSHAWIVLIFTGVSVAVIAAFIDIVSRWLGDIKFGHCTDAFYLTREYCCSGIDIQDECPKWESWEVSFHLRQSGAVGYILSYFFYILFTVLFAVSACVLVLFYAPHSRFSGIPEIKTILSGFVIKGFLGFRTLVVKSLGLILVVAAGLWVGKEGPLVHVACCCASVAMMLFPQIYRNEAIKREVLTAAASAGISVAFGSPIGGVLFSLEQLSYYFPERPMWNSFVAAMVAGVTLSFINPFRTGNLVLFQVVYDRVWHRFELVPFAIIGVLGGLYGAMFTQLNIFFAKWRRKSHFLSRRPIFEIFVVAIVTGLVTFPSLYTRIPSALSLAHLFQECTESSVGNLCKNEHWVSTVILLFSSSLIGFFLTAYTFGTNIPAGLIMPSMVNGAFFGRAVGILIQTWKLRHPGFIMFQSCPPDGVCITPGVYALVGAASTLCGVTHLTVSTVVIMFELTGALNYVIPIMTGVMVSKWVSDSFNHKGIYESWIQFKEYPFLDNHDDQPIPDVAVESIMTKVEDLTLIPAVGSNLGAFRETVETSQARGFPIVRSIDDMTLIGYITLVELRTALKKHADKSNDTPCTFGVLQTPTVSSYARNGDNLSVFEFDSAASSSSPAIDLSEWAELDPMTLSWESSLHLAASMFSKLGLRFILFTEKGELRGILTRKDVWLLLNSLDTDMSTSADEFLNETSARGRLMTTLSYSLRGSEDQIRLLENEDYDDDTDNEDDLVPDRA